ncbi:MAG: helix-turn-helix domain-containing protein [Actinomycetota bacterium]
MTTPSQARTLKARRQVHDGGATDRVRFLTHEPVEPGRVREPILASWTRSRALAVDADRIRPTLTADVDTDSLLARTAAPVLQALREQLDGQPMSILLTDPAGLVLNRQSGDSTLDRHLDRVNLAPGFSYAEACVGTNGIGTALEVGGPTYVFGHEHYAEHLEQLACAGVPIRHPLTGRTVGAIDLTCWVKDAGPLLLTLAKNTAEQIRQALAVSTSGGQMELLTEYLRTCRRLPGIVIAVGDESVIVNDHARSVLDPVDQAALVALAAEDRGDDHRWTTLVDLPSGGRARLYGQPVRPGPHSPGAVVHVRLLRADRGPLLGHPPGPWMPLPGLVGCSPAWQRACDQVEGASTADEWVVVAGEPGVGKLALLRAVQLRRQPVRRLVTLDAASAHADPHWSALARRLLADAGDSGDAVVITHVDVLDQARLRDLSTALVRAAAREPRSRPWVAVTVRDTHVGPELGRVLRLVPRTVDVPPLRLHLDDLEPLVTFFLGRLGQGDQVTCSSEAMQVLSRGTWPGNTAELLEMLRDLVRHRRSGAITAEELPAAVRTVSRRRLTVLESLERDAVVQALTDSAGDKTRAATRLGVSRATIYRKIHEYGIVDAAR